MAVTIERAPDHRNVLLITGDDLYFLQNDDPNVITTGGGVGRGQSGDQGLPRLLDRVQCRLHWRGERRRAGPGRDTTTAAGGGRAKSPPTTMDLATTTSQVVTLLQVVGHYWPAYTNLKFRWAGQVASYDPADWLRFNHETPFQGPLIGGRTNQHWAAWFHSDGSPMGGQNWTDMTRDGHLDRWAWHDRTDQVIHLAGLHAMTLPKGYCDLDLLTMGAKSVAECYPETQGRFSWLEPQFVVQPRTAAARPDLQKAYLAGVCVAYPPTDYVYFGFDTDHRVLGVYRTDGTRYGSADLGPTYQPAWVPHSGVALRVVRTGATLTFQARDDQLRTGLRVAQPNQTDLTGSACCHSLPVRRHPDHRQSDVRNGFHQLPHRRHPARHRDPVAVGLIVKTSTAVLVDAIYHNLETRQLPARRPFPPGPRPSPKTHRVHHLVPLPAAWARHPLRSAARERPGAGPADPRHPTRPGAGLARPAAPATGLRMDLDLPDTDPSIPPDDHTGSVDRAPRSCCAPPPATSRSAPR